MNVLVANIGSTSFKFRLFSFADGAERELASGGVDRIGGEGGVLTYSAGGDRLRQPCACADHGQAIRAALDAMVGKGALESPRSLDAVAFKAVMAGDSEPVVFVDDKVLAAMEYYAPAAPAHNPAYVAAMRSFREELAGTPLIAAFEPGFHRAIPARRRRYAIPAEWDSKFGIRRYGYHGASHRYVAERTAELMGPAAERIISCHLGGSSSLCAIRDGQSVATSMGFSPQSGLPQSNRVGEFDCFALALVQRETQMTLGQMLEALGSAAGLAAMSGTSGDMRDIESAAEGGDENARLSIDVFATAVRDALGAYLVELGGADAVVFTGGIGQHSPILRGKVCEGLAFAGIALDAAKNAAAEGECRIESKKSKTAIWVMPTNEELIVARQAAALLGQKPPGADFQNAERE